MNHAGSTPYLPSRRLWGRHPEAPGCAHRPGERRHLLSLVSRETAAMSISISKSIRGRTPLVVQGLRLHAPNSGAPGSILSQGTRSRLPQLRVRMPQLRPGAVKISGFFFFELIFLKRVSEGTSDKTQQRESVKQRSEK